MGRRPLLWDSRRPHSRVRCFQPLLSPLRAIVTVHCHCKPLPSLEADITHLTKSIPGQEPHQGLGVAKKGFAQVRVSWKDILKFLAGASLVNAGVLFYLYLTNTAVPVLGTHFVMEPEANGLRSFVHFLFFLICYPEVTGAVYSECQGSCGGAAGASGQCRLQTIQPSSTALSFAAIQARTRTSSEVSRLSLRSFDGTHHLPT